MKYTIKHLSSLTTLVAIFVGVATVPTLALAAKEAVLMISTKGEAMAFDKATLSAKPGQKIKLTFKNASNMQHNFVVVKPGTADQVTTDSITAGGDKGWLAIGPNVLAHTKLVNPKESDTIIFTAPAQSGEYPYICSFPGHSAMMRGILVVK